jgi:signal transduction histidine kinase
MGLRIMQSRAGMIGGTIAVERGAGKGVQVTCAVPENGALPKARNNHAYKK